MHEHVGAVRVDLGGLERARVARDRDPAAGPDRADDLLGPHAGDLLPTLQAAEVRPLGHAERARRRGIEAAGAVVLDERVAVRGHAVVDREGRDDVAAEAHLLVRLELTQLERVAGASDHGPHRLDQREQPRRAVERSGRSRPRRSKVLTMPISPSQWSRW